MSFLGVIGGSNFLKSGYFASEDFDVQVESTQYGLVKLYVNIKDNVIFVQRHAADPDVPYSPPHLINKKAIITALKLRGVNRIFAFNSTGAMKRTLSIGTIVIPDDYLCLTPITFYDDYRAHVIPGFNEELRQQIIDELKKNNITPVTHATYVQTNGPRFETKAEIALFATQSDIVGMTSAHEAILSQEIGIPYASICMVDNFANGIATPLTTDEFHKGVNENLKTVEKVLSIIIDKFALKNIEAVMPKTKVHSMVHARWIIPMKEKEEDVVLDHHTIVYDETGTITEVLPTSEAKEKYTAYQVTDLSHKHVIHPGLINAHTHLGMTLLRGYSDDKNLTDWLIKDIWPMEGALANKGHRFVYTSALLGLSEMVRSGTTCFNDMYMVPEQTAEAALEVGVRGIISFPVMRQPWLPEFEQQCLEGEMVREKIKGSELLSIACAPHAPYTVDEATFVKSREWNRNNNVISKDGSIMHVHLHETESEVENSIKGEGPNAHLSEHRISPIMNLHRLGLLDKKTVAAHGVVLNDEEIKILAECKANVIHCPCSNLKLASGFCPLAKLLEAGVNVGLGTDSTASNNGLDMYAEMKTAAILAKAVKKDPQVVSATTALKMATINNARALGLDHLIGSIEVGKKADIVAVKMSSMESIPVYNVLSQVVYTGNAQFVTDVWVNGKRLLNNKFLVSCDKHAVYKKVADLHEIILETQKRLNEPVTDIEVEEKTN